MHILFRGNYTNYKLKICLEFIDKRKNCNCALLYWQLNLYFFFSLHTCTCTSAYVYLRVPTCTCWAWLWCGGRTVSHCTQKCQASISCSASLWRGPGRSSRRGGKATSGKKPFTLCVHNLLNKETMIYYYEEVYSLLEYVRHQHRKYRGLYTGKYPGGGVYQPMPFGGKNMKREREKE
jgi:hypothetical protein